MKNQFVRFLSLIFAFLLLTSCGTTEETEKAEEVVVETIEFDQLIDDLENGARAKMNIGKATTVFGQIDYIASDCCTINLLYPAGRKAHILLPIEVLAELENEQFIAVSAIINKVGGHNASGSIYTYTFKADKLADLSLMDEYIKNSVSGDFSFYNYKEDHSLKLLGDYITSRKDGFLLTDDKEIEKYVIGRWSRYFRDSGSYLTGDEEFRADGTFDEIASNDYVKWTGKWSASNGVFKRSSFDIEVYAVCDDLILCHFLDYYDNSADKWYVKQ